jgi:stress response protein YsnF
MTHELPDTSVQLIEEKLEVAVQENVTGRIRVRTITETFDEVVRQELRGVRANVVRTPVGRTLEPGEVPPAPRTEHGVTIIPIFEEIIVVEKRLVLKEELHIIQEETIEEIEVPVSTRKQRAVVERLTPNDEPEPSRGATNDRSEQ